MWCLTLEIAAFRFSVAVGHFVVLAHELQL